MSLDRDSDTDSFDRRPRKQTIDYDAFGIDGDDMAAVESLAEAQRSIEVSISSVTSGLADIQALTAHMSALQAGFATLFDDYRRSTLASLKLEQDRDRYSDQAREKSQELESVRAEAASLRREVETMRGNLAKAQSDLEASEKRNHLLEISRKEVEQQLIAATSELRVVGEDAETYRLELASLRQQVDGDASKLADLSARHQEVYQKSLLLSERCENHEKTLQASYDQIAGLRANVESLTQERDSFQSYAQQKDAETAQLRSDLFKTVEKSQSDIRAKDKDVADLRAENESIRASAKIFEQVNLELKFDNEAKSSQIRHQEEAISKLELTVNKLEAKLGRVSTDLDAALAAKAQTDQSRAAMASRVESMSQALRGREADVFRLENEIASLTTQLENHDGRSRSTIESLESRIFELEKDLSAQKNETAYYYAQLEIMKKPENRMPGAPE